MTDVRDLRADEARSIGDLLSRAGFGPTVAGLLAFPRESPHGDVLVAERDGRRLAFFSTIATFGTALDVTVAELAVESFFPADDATAEALRAVWR